MYNVATAFTRLGQDMVEVETIAYDVIIGAVVFLVKGRTTKTIQV
jgi:hypothetical protein